MQRKTVFVAIVVMVLIGSVAVWKLRISAPASAPIAVVNPGWKVYQDNANGFSFEYPSTLMVDKQDNNGYSIIYVTDPRNHARYVSIMIVNDPSQPDINEIFTGPYPKEIPPTGNNSTTTVEQRTLHGLQGVEAYGYTQEGHSYSDVFMYKRDHLWKMYLDPVLEGRIPTYPESGTPTPDKDTYKQILASVKISS